MWSFCGTELLCYDSSISSYLLIYKRELQSHGRTRQRFCVKLNDIESELDKGTSLVILETNLTYKISNKKSKLMLCNYFGTSNKISKPKQADKLFTSFSANIHQKNKKKNRRFKKSAILLHNMPFYWSIPETGLCFMVNLVKLKKSFGLLVKYPMCL